MPGFWRHRDGVQCVLLQWSVTELRLLLLGETEGSSVGTQLSKGYPGRRCVNDVLESVCGFSSDARFVYLRIPKFIVLDQGVDDREQLSHRGGQGDFLRFAFGEQALVEHSNPGIEPRGH